MFTEFRPASHTETPNPYGNTGDSSLISLKLLKLKLPFNFRDRYIKDTAGNWSFARNTTRWRYSKPFGSKEFSNVDGSNLCLWSAV